MAKNPRSTGGPNKRAGEKGPNTGGNLCKPFDKERKAKFCQALIENRGNREAACRAIGVHHTTVSNHYTSDMEFRADYEAALEQYRHVLVSEAHRRGVEGVKKPIYFQGKRVFDVDEDGDPIPAFIQEYDTQLLLALLKRWCPEFREKSVVENHNVNLDMGLADLTELSPEQRDKLRELIDLKEDNE